MQQPAQEGRGRGPGGRGEGKARDAKHKGAQSATVSGAVADNNETSMDHSTVAWLYETMAVS